jgi:Lipase (class 3)
MKSLFYMLFVSLFLDSNGFSREFGPTTDLSEERIFQILEISRDVYPFSIETTELAEGRRRETYTRNINGRNYEARPFYGDTVFGAHSCLGALYRDLENPEAIFLAHRGTICYVLGRFWVSDLLADLNVAPIEIERVPGTVHAGFQNCHESAYREIKRMLKGVLAEIPETEIFAIGHSLGGALASLSAVKMYRDEELPSGQVKVVSFSSPKIGSHDFITRAEELVGMRNVINFHCGLDIVASLPPQFLGFKEFGVPIRTLFLERLVDKGFHGVLDGGLGDFLWAGARLAAIVGPGVAAFGVGGGVAALAIAEQPARDFVKAFCRILLDAHGIGMDESIIRSFLYFSENMRIDGISFKDAGSPSFFSGERNPIINKLRKLICG